MALTVNTNVASLNAQRNLKVSTVALNKSLERLSSGLRINRAGDDAAGLAISEALRGQIRGLQQAVRNANDGLSLVGTAEGALAEATNIIQRVRELSIQAANGTNSDGNRASLQNEINQLIEELDRIGNTTQFNGRNLLDGTFQGVTLQVGANRNQTIDISIDETRASNLGAVAESVGTALADGLSAGDLDDILINGFAIDNPLAGDDTVSFSGNALSAISLAAAINRGQGQTGGVVAEIVSTAEVGAAAVGGGTLDGTNSLTINGVGITGTFVANDTNGAFVDAINAASLQTGVRAVNNSGTITLTAEDGRNVTVTTAGTGHTISGLNGSATTIVAKGSVTLRSSKPFTLAGTDVTNAGHAATSFTIDANTAINSVDVSTQQGAQDTIRVADFAMAQLNEVRAKLGAITNRLESTIANLQTTAENLSASESRIRDADFALETATLTRNQILQQAGVSVLAQANLVPQTALSLLQR
jgi:flagellin